MLEVEVFKTHMGVLRLTDQFIRLLEVPYLRITSLEVSGDKSARNLRCLFMHFVAAKAVAVKPVGPT